MITESSDVVAIFLKSVGVWSLNLTAQFDTRIANFGPSYTL